MASSAEVEKGRQRDALARLIAAIFPDAAQTLADKLIDEFGSLAATMSGSAEAIGNAVCGYEPVASLLAAAREAAIQSFRSELSKAKIDATNQRLIDYLIADMGCRSNETLRVLFLNNANFLIRDEIIAEGTVRQLQLYPRRIFRRALELNASALILVHNHPGGSPKPSSNDIEATRIVSALGATLDVTIHDHIIIAGSRWNSLKNSGAI